MAKIDEHIKVMMLKGETGANINSISKTATSGLVDTYTVTLTDGTKSNFTVTNGRDGKDGADFDTFEIGGRNLIRNSAKLDIPSDKGNLYVGAYGEATIEDRGDGFKEAKAMSPYTGIGVFANTLDINPGDTVMFSATFEPSGRDLTPGFYAMCFNADKTVRYEEVFSLNGNTTLATHTVFGKVKDGDSKRLSVLIKWTDEAKRIIDSGGFIRFTVQSEIDLVAGSGNSLSIYAPKLERSTKPSDWTPAPEDKADVSELAKKADVSALASKADVSTIVPKASVESSTTASQAYSAGQYVVVNGILRNATAAIAKGDAISDTNSTATTVAGELSKKVDSSELAGEWVTMLSSDGAWYCKRASMVIVQANNVTLSSDVKRTLGTLPSGYRPLMPSGRTSLIATTTYSQYTGILEVTSGGEVAMQAPMSGDYTGQLVFPAAL